MNHWAIIPTHNRHDLLTGLVLGLLEDKVRVVVIDNASDPPINLRAWQLAALDDLYVIHDPEQPPNLSRLWNVGLNHVARQQPCDDEYIVAILNDDVQPPPGFVEQLGRAILARSAAAAFPAPTALADYVLRDAGPVPLTHRMTGFAFALRGTAGLRADERLRWWYGDDDLDWTARQAGGVIGVSGLRVEHAHPNGWQQTHPELLEQAGHDRETFVSKWGRAPW